MKRKVKFQEGGMVETPSRRRARLADSARDRAAEFRAAQQRDAARRAAAQRSIDVLNPEATAGEVERRAGRAVPERRPDFTTDPRGVTRRGAATGRELVPFEEGRPPRTTARQALAQVGTPRQIPLGRTRAPVGGNLAALGGAIAMELAEPLANYGRRFMERRGAEIAAGNETRRAQDAAMQTADVPGMQAANRGGDAAAARMREVDMQGADVPGNRAMSPPAPPRPRPRPAAPPRRELTAEELRALLSGEREPRTSEERALREGLRNLPQSQPRLSEADILNQRELDRLREIERMRAEREAAAQMGGSGDIGAASARARGEQVGPPGEYNNFKRGGMVKSKAKPVVKKKAGGMVAAKPKAAPKKMMKGGIVAKPKSKAKPAAKPMPFKKGGVIKKGRK